MYINNVNTVAASELQLNEATGDENTLLVWLVW